ncbi:MAG TPA: nodulation protein NfeD [Firmicutes bacterium]|nr:nodulation protein NfeD [Bacillota bacterium]
MFKKSGVLLYLFLVLLILSTFYTCPVVSSASSSVYIVPVKGEIDPGWGHFLERSLEEAEAVGAVAVVLEFDTPGGYIDTAQKAGELLSDFCAPIYAYVKPRALSAGAYLALCTDGIYMAPGAMIGAAEPRILGSEVTDEKLVSAWEAEMRGAAEKQGKDPRLAAAMVRREIEIEDLVSGEELLTLTAAQAESLGFSDGTVSDIYELLGIIGQEDAETVRLSPSGWEKLSGWLIKPAVATIILSLAFIFLILEVLTAGFGIAGLLSILCFGLYFGGHFFAGVSGWPAIFLFLLGIVLLLVEAFIPGFGIFGLGGLVSVFAAILLSAASAEAGLRMLFISIVVSIVAGYLAFKYFQRKGVLRRFILYEAATREEGYSSSADYSHLAGKRGKSITPLRPAGIAEIEGSRLDVVSEGTYIPAGVEIEVIKVEGRRIVVRSKQ